MLHESIQISKKKKALALEGIIKIFHDNEIPYAQATNLLEYIDRHINLYRTMAEYDFTEANPHKIKDLSSEVVDCHFDPDYINSAMRSNDEIDWV